MNRHPFLSFFLTDESFSRNITHTTTVATHISGNPGSTVLQFFAWGGGLYTLTVTAWSLSDGPRVSCSWGFTISCCIFFTSEANTLS